MAKVGSGVVTHVGLLRGINVGGHRVTMDRLCGLAVGAGATVAESAIASGNLGIGWGRRATDAAIEAALEASFVADLGYAVPTMVRSLAEMSQLAAAADAGGPFADEVHVTETPAGVARKVQIGFSDTAASAAVGAAVAGLTNDYDRLAVVGREVWWRTNGNISDTLVPPQVFAKAFPHDVTFRNVTTVAKLAARWR